jgi:hypothetical protein
MVFQQHALYSPSVAWVDRRRARSAASASVPPLALEPALTVPLIMIPGCCSVLAAWAGGIARVGRLLLLEPAEHVKCAAQRLGAACHRIESQGISTDTARVKLELEASMRESDGGRFPCMPLVGESAPVCGRKPPCVRVTAAA